MAFEGWFSRAHMRAHHTNDSVVSGSGRRRRGEGDTCVSKSPPFYHLHYVTFVCQLHHVTLNVDGVTLGVASDGVTRIAFLDTLRCVLRTKER